MNSSRPAAPPAVSGNAVFLVGFMGAGKSSVGRALGQLLNWVFEDLDDRIERREGRTIAEIFRNSGEPQFRRAEWAALEQLLEELRQGVAAVVALGGGTFAQPRVHQFLQKSGVKTVFLEAPLTELWQRCVLQETGAKRPLQDSQNLFRVRYEARRPFYETASLQIHTSGKQVEMIAAEIIEKLKLKPIATRTEQGESE